MGSKTPRTFAAFVLLAFLGLGCANHANGQAGSDPALEKPAPSPKQTVTVTPAANDAAIAKRLQGILDSTGWFGNPRVSVREGVVSLEGTATSQEHRRWAADLAEKTQDVVAVINRIEVEADAGSTFGRAGEEFRDVYRRAVGSWPLIALVMIIFLVTWALAKIVLLLARRMLADRISSPLLLAVVARALSIPIYIFGLYFILQIAGLTRLALTILGGTGLIGIIIGFSFRDIAENFLASLLLSMRNPFRSGDLVEVAGHTGVVQNLNTRSTVLLTLDGSHVQVPNAIVYKSTIKNFSSNSSRRASFGVGIGYDSSAAKAQGLIADVLREHPAVKDVPEPSVLLEELGEATMNLRIHYWFDSAIHSPARINSALLRQTKNALIGGGISLPDPAREVVFPDGVPIKLVRGSEKDSQSTTDRSVGSSEHGVATIEDNRDSTFGEGNLSSETRSVVDQAGAVPESKENLLKE